MAEQTCEIPCAMEAGPATEQELHEWIVRNTGLSIPRQAVCPNHCAPFEYVRRAYFEPACDLVVWAPRGGGKTRLAALATLLDLLFKPSCAVRILGGSLQQSLRMWEHLWPDVQRLAQERICKPGRQGGAARAIRMVNGASAAVLTQSERAVRGLRVQKLRCDEVELFKPPIWEAAQLATRSGPAKIDGTQAVVRGCIEAISTYHMVGGLMGRIIDRARRTELPVLQWCVLEVLEKCPPQRLCEGCALWEECGGKAKSACEGFLSIDDAIAMKHRVSAETWDAEMRCKRPSTRGAVFPNFDPQIHVNAQAAAAESGGAPTDLAIDFGFHAPFVCLWITEQDDRIRVIDEYVQEQRVIAEHVEQIESRPWGKPRRICCDPAGAGRNDQTAESNIQFLRRHGYRVCAKHTRIVEGLEMIRAALRPAAGLPRLFIHPRCKRLIAAMQGYHYSTAEGGELPLKDGIHDHLIDALRYWFVNRAASAKVVQRTY